jgi:hypothetical protein
MSAAPHLQCIKNATPGDVARLLNGRSVASMGHNIITMADRTVIRVNGAAELESVGLVLLGDQKNGRGTTITGMVEFRPEHPREPRRIDLLSGTRTAIRLRIRGQFSLSVVEWASADDLEGFAAALRQGVEEIATWSHDDEWGDEIVDTSWILVAAFLADRGYGPTAHQ